MTSAGYTNGILMAILRPGLSGWVADSDPSSPQLSAMTSGQVVTKLPADVTKRLPVLHARQTPGGTNKGPRRDTKVAVPFQIDAYHVDSRPAAELAEFALWLLHDAWSRQTLTTDGHIGRLANISGPFEFPDPQQPDGLSRWLMTATLTVRPPVA